LTSETTTFAPSFAISSAVARPIPLPEPVTTHTLSCSFMSTSIDLEGSSSFAHRGGRKGGTVFAVPTPFLSPFRGPTPPRVRPDALRAAYVVRRTGDATVASRRDASGAEHELAAARSRAGLGGSRLAAAILRDALDEPPPRRLVKDYSRFIVPRRGGELVVVGDELQAWLETWRPGLLSLLGSGR
jgi:hypothetical protein